MEDQKPGKPVNEYVKYSGIGFQMLITILLGVFGGKKLDQWLGTKFPLFTLLFTLAAVGISMYVIIKEFTKKKDE